MSRATKYIIICSIIAFVSLWINGKSYGEPNVPCAGDKATLECLKENFDKLAAADDDLFYDILRDGEKKADNCKNVSDTVSFLELAKIHTSNIEFQEYFSEAIENLLFSKPTYFFDSLLISNLETKKAVIRYLKFDTFHEPYKINRVFLRYRKEEKYKQIMDLYFNEVNK